MFVSLKWPHSVSGSPFSKWVSLEGEGGVVHGSFVLWIFRMDKQWQYVPFCLLLLQKLCHNVMS